METRARPSSPEYANVPHTALVFLCPSCESELVYGGSRPTEGGTTPADLHDYFRCPAGCGTYEHDRRAHRMRQCEEPR